MSLHPCTAHCAVATRQWNCWAGGWPKMCFMSPVAALSQNKRNLFYLMLVDCHCEIVLILYPLWVQSWFPYYPFPTFYCCSLTEKCTILKCSWHIYSVLTIVSWTTITNDGVICEVNLEEMQRMLHMHCHAPGHAPWPRYQSRCYLPTYKQ